VGFYNTTPLPTAVFVAPTGTGVYPVLRLRNESPSQTLFVGLSACTPNTGIPLPPNSAIELSNAGKNIYACSNWAAGTAAATASASASVTVGTTSFTVASGGMANIPVGTYFLIGTGTGQEALSVATSASTTTITTTTGTLFEHYASEVLYAVTTTPGVLRVQAGTGLPPVSQAAFPVASG
jgi:type IV secretory pathway TrbL component